MCSGPSFSYPVKTLISGLQRSLSDLRYRREIAREIQTVRPASKMSRIRNLDWENDENLKADIQKYVLQNLTRREVLDFLGQDYPQYVWSLPTLSRWMAHFEVKYVDYETDLKVVEKAVKEEISGPGQLLGGRLLCEPFFASREPLLRAPKFSRQKIQNRTLLGTVHRILFYA